MSQITPLLLAATALLCFTYVFGVSVCDVASTPTPNCPAADQCSFLEHFSCISDRWIVSDGFANGGVFDAWWSKSKAVIDFSNRVLKLGVDSDPNLGKPYAAGELATNQWHGYGCYEAPLDILTYTGPYSAAPGANKTHNEIDIEFVWRQTEGKLLLQCTYFTKRSMSNAYYVNLPFNLALSFHNYAFRWTLKNIEWFVDGTSVYTAYYNIPQVAEAPHKIMLNFWPVSSSASIWAGTYNHQGPRYALYEGVRFTKGENYQIMNNF